MSTVARVAPPLHPDKVSESCKLFLGTTGMMTFFATVSVVLRFISRQMTPKRWWDDWAVLAALVFAYAFLTTIALVSTVGGAGYHVNEYSLAQLEIFLQITLANNIFYNASITLSKASILLFYHRIFSIEQWLHKSTQVLGVVLVGNFIAATCGLIFSNSPTEGQWELWVPSTSINNKAFWLAMGIINMALDIVILALPQARVWKLQLSRTKKFLVSLVFLLGGFVCITSVVRIVSLLTIDISDLTYTLPVPGIWTLVEMDTSIICACLPTFPGLLKAFGNKRRKPITNTSCITGGRSTRLRSALENKPNGSADLQGPRVSTKVEVAYECDHEMAPLGSYLGDI